MNLHNKFKEKFLIDYSNKYPNLFAPFIEKTKDYIVFDNRNYVSNDFSLLTSEKLKNNKDNIIKLLDEFIIGQHQKNKMYYSISVCNECFCDLLKMKYSSSVYNQSKNILNLDYFTIGQLAVSPHKIFAFLNRKERRKWTEIILYSHEPLDKAIKIYEKIFIDVNITKDNIKYDYINLINL